MIDFHWKIFSKTGNIETYLLMKEIETMYKSSCSPQQNNVIELPDFKSVNAKM